MSSSLTYLPKDPLGTVNYPIRGFEVYDGPSQVENCDFYGYQDGPTSKRQAISVLFRDRFEVARMNSAKQVRFINSKPVGFPVKDNFGDQHVWLRDLDGSITGRTNAVVVQDFPFYRTASCQVPTGWSAMVCPDHFSSFSINIGDANTKVRQRCQVWKN